MGNKARGRAKVRKIRGEHLIKCYKCCKRFIPLPPLLRVVKVMPLVAHSTLVRQLANRFNFNFNTCYIPQFAAVTLPHVSQVRPGSKAFRQSGELQLHLHSVWSGRIKCAHLSTWHLQIHANANCRSFLSCAQYKFPSSRCGAIKKGTP